MDSYEKCVIGISTSCTKGNTKSSLHYGPIPLYHFLCPVRSAGLGDRALGSKFLLEIDSSPFPTHDLTWLMTSNSQSALISSGSRGMKPEVRMLEDEDVILAVDKLTGK